MAKPQLSAAATLDLWQEAEGRDPVGRSLALASVRAARSTSSPRCRSGGGTRCCSSCTPATGLTRRPRAPRAASRPSSPWSGTRCWRVRATRGRVEWRPPDSTDVAAAAATADAAAAERVLLERCARLGGPLAEERAALRRGVAEADPLAEVLVDVACPACGQEFVADLDVGAFVWADVRPARSGCCSRSTRSPAPTAGRRPRCSRSASAAGRPISSWRRRARELPRRRSRRPRVGRGLPRSRRRAAGARAGRSRAQLRAALPAEAPEEGEPFADVLRDLDAVLLPAVTHWQHPRFFAYFATSGSEPGILADFLAAALNNVGILWRTSPALQELEEVTTAWLAALLGLPAGWHGSLEHGASISTLAALAAARGRSAARPGGRLLRARALVGRQGLPAARARGAQGGGRRGVPAARGRARPRRRLRGRGDGRARPRRRRSTRSRRSRTPVRTPTSGSTSTPRTRARDDLPGVPLGVRGRRARRLSGRQPAQVALDAAGLLGLLDPPARGPARRVQPRPRVPPHRGRGRQPQRVRARARPLVPGAQALGGAALPRARGAPGAHPQERARGGDVRGVGRRGGRAGS